MNTHYHFHYCFYVEAILYVKDVHGKKVFYAWNYNNYKTTLIAEDTMKMYMMGEEL